MKVEVKMRCFRAPSLLTIALALFWACAFPAHPQSGSVPSVSAGGVVWGGYSLGFLQEAIYFSVPFDGISGGGSIDCRAFIFDILGVRPGARAELGANYSVNADVSGLELDLAADLVIGFDYIPWLKPYVFGGVMVNSLGVSYAGGDGWASQAGWGLRYGGAVFFDVFEFSGFGSVRAVVSAGAEFTFAHVFLPDPANGYIDFIYNSKQLRVPIRISLFFVEGK
jgi:hypothetical protein